MTARPSRVQTDHFHLPRPRRFSSMSNDAKLYPRSDMSRRDPVCEAAMEFVEQSLLVLDSTFVQFTLLLCLRAREQQATAVDYLFAASDQQVLNAAHDTLLMRDEADDVSFVTGNVTGNVSATRASSAVCSSAIRLSMKLRSRSDNFVRSSLR
jgi:hypothetical protein